MNTLARHPKAQIVALCDVDANSLDKAAKAFPGARTYTDWREMLEKEGSKIDSVNVSVPDHMHFPIAYSAIQKGKHVYCQKPMCHDVAEVRTLTEASVRKGVVTQLGTQMAANLGERTVVHFLKTGAIGRIQHAYLCSNRPGAVETYRLAGPRPASGQEPPTHLHWDLWLGTAPVRPYVPEIYHPVKWRAWQDFGTGWSGDIGCGVQIYTHSTLRRCVSGRLHDEVEREAVSIGDHVFIGPNATILMGVNIGDRAVISADAENEPASSRFASSSPRTRPRA